MLMARRDRAYGAGDTLIDARDRVDAATAERSRLSGERNSANGTSRELETEGVAAFRDSWNKLLDTLKKKCFEVAKDFAGQ